MSGAEARLRLGVGCNEMLKLSWDDVGSRGQEGWFSGKTGYIPR